MFWNPKWFPGTNLQDLNLDWILKKIAALRGGTAGQYLYKKSNKDFDFGWKTGSGGSGGSGENGYTFTPSVSEEGVISWTNDGDLPNPEPVNIKGPAGNDGTNGSNGATFTPAVSSAGVLSWTNDGGLPNPESVNIKGPAGNDGTNGSNGATFTPAVSSAGVLSWTNDGGLPNPESVNIKGPAGLGLPAGGVAGQFPVKSGSGDYAVEWAAQKNYTLESSDFTLTTGYANRVGNIVFFNLRVNRAETTDPTTLCTIPIGARPAQDIAIRVPVERSGVGYCPAVVLQNTGDVITVSSGIGDIRVCLMYFTSDPYV